MCVKRDGEREEESAGAFSIRHEDAAEVNPGAKMQIIILIIINKSHL